MFGDVQTITAGWHTLLRQAPMTADTYMGAAVKYIDEQFGDGYAAKHPELVGAFMQTCASDFNTAAVKIGLQEICAAIDVALSGLELSGLREISASLDSIAEHMTQLSAATLMSGGS